jgi:GT2 family glycosyltransferase
MAGLAPPVTICVLLYGDHYALCERFFAKLLQHTRPDLFQLRIGLNAVSQATLDYVSRQVPSENVHVFRSESNLYKGGMMRRMFYEAPVRTPWTIWFDDDSYPMRSDWLEALVLAIEAFPHIDLFGKHLFLYPNERLVSFLRTSRWFRGLEFQKDAQGRTIIEFIAGGFWAVRSQWIYKLDWPDPRISHFEEDCIFSEALRQNGGRIQQFTSGVIVNAAARRCGPETPSSY